MKKRVAFFIFSLLAINNFLIGQAVLPTGLNLNNRSDMTFQEIKTTINNYYTNIVTTSRDSLEVKRSSRQLKLWNREFWLSENYLNAEGKIEDVNKKIMEALNKEQREREPGNSNFQTSFWSQNGPTSCNFSIDMGEGMGRVDRIAFHPSNLSIIFAGTPHGGLFKSTDAGASWNPISAFIPTLGIAGIAIHPTNADIIYILSGDGNSTDGSFVNKYLYRSECTGVYKTTNGGDTWLKVEEFDSNTGLYQGRQLIIDPNNANILYAATSKGLFKTDDGGNTWVLRSSVENIWDVKFKPGNSQTVYYVTKNKFYHSENGGYHFDETVIDYLDEATRISMAVTPANSSRVMLLAGKSVTGTPDPDDEFEGIFSSSNSGIDFSRIYVEQNIEENLFNNYIDLDVTSGQVDYNNTIVIHPTNANIVLVGGLCVWSSQDGGYTWEQETAYWAPSDILHEYIHPDVHHLAYNSNGTLYCGNDGGVYKSYDDGDDWDFMSVGLTATQFYHFEKENDEGDTWGGAQDNGILERETGGVFYVYAGGDGYDMMTDHPYVVADGESDDIYYTVNKSIRGDGSDISVPGNTSYFGNLAMSPLYEDLIYVGYEQAVYRSDNAGGDWTNLGGNIPGNWDISTCPSFNGRIYAAGVNDYFPGGIRKREDGNWTGLTTALYAVGYNSSQKITGIEVHESTSDKVYISCAGLIANSKVYYTSNGGTSWNNWTFNLPNVPVFSIKRDGSGGLYVGTSIGVYYKRNNVNYWEPFSNGLPAVPVTQIELFGTTGLVMISTFGRGLWTTPFYTSDCPANLTLTTSPYGNYYKEASISITSTQNISETTGTTVKYNAGTNIILLPGFKAPKGTIFKTYLTGCGGEID
jgi:hypothetical protein